MILETAAFGGRRRGLMRVPMANGRISLEGFDARGSIIKALCMANDPTQTDPVSGTAVKVGDSAFDPGALGNWIEAHLWVFLLIAAVGFVFFIFQKGGFAEKFLDYRIKREELDAKQLENAKAITDAFRRKHDRPDPLLPFGDNDVNGDLR